MSRIVSVISLVLLVGLLLRPAPAPTAPSVAPLADAFTFDTLAKRASIRFVVRNRLNSEIALAGCYSRESLSGTGPTILIEARHAGRWVRYSTVRFCDHRSAFAVAQDSSTSLNFIVQSPGQYRATVLWRRAVRFGTYHRVSTPAVSVNLPVSRPPNQGS